MALPLAAAAFWVTAAVCQEKKKTIKGDQFINDGIECGFFVQDESQSFKVGDVNMGQFIQSSISSLPSVKAVSVKADGNRVQIEVTVDEFDWANLEPIYDKELDLSYMFREQSLDFRVIDGSAGEAANAR